MTSPSATASTASAALVAALQVVLAAEHAAIFSYPALGVHLEDSSQTERARAAEAAHRVTRDALLAQLTALGATPVTAAVDYRPATPVTDAATAQRWALTVESTVATAYRALLATTASATMSALPPSSSLASYRGQSLNGLTAAAAAEWHWRALVAPSKPTAAFPGL